VEKEFLALAEREGLSDGTTAVVALVQEDKLTVAHVGDSRGVLCRNGSALAVTQDHKPEVAIERYIYIYIYQHRYVYMYIHQYT